jgi:hypothetical protein
MDCDIDIALSNLPESRRRPPFNKRWIATFHTIDENQNYFESEASLQ